MTPTPDKLPASRPMPLDELMTRFLGRQSAAVVAGMASVPPGVVEPHEAVPVQAVDPKQAWDGATAVLAFSGGLTKSIKASPDWPSLVAAQPSHMGLAFAAGNFPQMVRDLTPLYREAESLGDLPMADAPPVPVDIGSTTKEFPRVLLTLGTLRLARQWDAADALIAEVGDQVPEKWAAAWANEIAAILWHRGNKAEAAKRWQRLPETVPVLFNRGMAALFTGRPNDARSDLRRAVEQIPESSGWHHLGRLYLALAGG